ncbi:cytoskeleton-associated protein 2 isoform X2 [Hoplias malabaricus]|uniref:cytoskeleton-associated protein 2 isoform X2 n=1 Tax=Hoplias malabaricus TaxID=27720 RepID=UPI0034623E29
MDTAVKKSNKENTKPVATQKRPEPKNVISKQRPVKAAPLQSKNDRKEEKKEVSVGEKSEAKEQVKPVTKTTTVSDPNTRKTLSQAFRTEQSVRHRKLVAEAPKPPSTVLSKPVPGTYKGRVVKSKIDCFRKPSLSEEKTSEVTTTSKFTKPSVPKPKPKSGLGTLSKVQSKSVTTLPGSSKPRPGPSFPSRTKSVSDAQLNVTEKPIQRSVSQRTIPPKGPAFTRPTVPHSARPAAVSTARPESSKVTSFIKKKEPVIRSSKPKPAAPVIERKIQRPASSTISQYRVQTDTTDERRAKLAEWLASKGKTLKRPPMSEKTAPKANKPAPQPKATEEPSKLPETETQTQTEPTRPGSEEIKRTQLQQDTVPRNKPVFSSSPSHILNTTLDLLDNSDMDLPVDPEIRMESLVLNLCDKLDAMETPSRENGGSRSESLTETSISCGNDTESEESDEAENLFNVKVEDTTEKEFEILEEEELNLKKEDGVTEERKEVKEDPAEKVPEQKEKKLFEDDVDEKMDFAEAEVKGASVVKYSVKTTPFLQSVKKRIECEDQAPCSTSRRKSAIKDLKFLTPVRRSSRIQRNSSRLPEMLNDRDPCVSSLAELLQLEDADSSAYIYRKNPALLEQLPDQTGDLQRLSAEKK